MVNRSGVVLVTGASGFIGRHIVQRLEENHCRVRALVHRVPLQGFGPSVEMVRGDLTKPETFSPALDGVSAVVHAALTRDYSGDVQATSMLHQLSARAGVRKFVHLSSIAVYGSPSSGTITEETLPIPVSDPYTSAKLAIEKALGAGSEVPEVTVLRLGCVYGPGEGWWTQGLLRLMERGPLILVDGGIGTANLIHVVDVSTLVVHVLMRSSPPFEVFNVTDGMPVSWRSYLSELEKVLGRTATVSMTVAEAKDYGKKWLRPSLARRVIRKLPGWKHIHALEEHAIESFASRAVYSNEKAATVLAFRPAYDLPAGMRTVAQLAHAVRPQVGVDDGGIPARQFDKQLTKPGL